MKTLFLSIAISFILCSQVICQQDSSKNFISTWEGKLKIQNFSLRLVLRVLQNADGTLGAFLDSPDQSAKDIPVSSIELTQDSLKFTSQIIGASYTGKIEKDSMVAVGKFNQAALNLDLNLKKVDKASEVRRPQNPQKPYPYNEEEISFENKLAGIKLAGTFTFPKGDEKYPAVVLVSGSGPQDRNEEVFNHKLFLILADYLTKNGIAVLRYDDRGIGKSTGNFVTATTEDFATDAIAAVEYLKTRNEVDKIGIIGHSEGGMIAPMTALKSNDINFIILLAGVGTMGKDLLLTQSKLMMEASGAKDDEIEKALKQSEEAFNIVIDAKDSITAYNQLEELYNNEIASLTEEEKKNPDYDRSTFERNVKIILSPWFRYFLKFNPAPILKKVTVPVLALNGEKDLQVEPKANLMGIEQALKEGGNKNFKVVELPGLNHLFQTAKTGTVEEYAQIEETFSPAALKIVGDWILQTIK